MKIRALGFLIGLFLNGSSLLLAAEGSWVLAHDESGIQVFTRHVENSPILEFKAEMTVDGDPEQIAALYEQPERITEWFHRSKEARLLKQVSPDESWIYFAADLPWPLSDRDGVYRRVRVRDAETGALTYRLSAVHDAIAKRKDRVRVNYLNAQWSFQPAGRGRTEISYRMHTEAGGYIPAGVINRFTVSLPFKTFLKFRTLLEKERPSLHAAAS